MVSNRGFERAAQKLFITQSAVSRRIRQLEEYIGEPVIVRTQPPVATSAGQRLLTHLQQVLQLEAALGVASDPLTTSDRILSVRMAINADSLATWLPRALALPDYHFSFDFLVEDQFKGFAVSSSTGSSHHTMISTPPSGPMPFKSSSVGLLKSNVSEITFSLLGIPISIFWTLSMHVMPLLLELLIIGSKAFINRV